MRVSPGHSSSTPPLKKYVTCAYFSVSATWSWRAPAAASVSASVYRTSCSPNATGTSSSDE